MATSKLVNANRKIAENVTQGFGAMCDTVVGGYTKIEDAFVERYLTHDGESVAEAKERLADEQAAREEESRRRAEERSAAIHNHRHSHTSR